MKILSIGNALVDILIRLENDDIIHKLSYPKGSMQLIDAIEIPRIAHEIETLPFQMVSGGSAANTIHGLASMGAICGYIGCVGRDELGHFYESDLTNLNIHCKLRRSSTETGRAFTLISPDSERTFATYLGAAIELQPEDIEASDLKGYEILHIEGYLVQNSELIENVMKLARENGVKISLDLASYNVVELNLDFLKRIIPSYVDIVFANEEEAKAYTGKEPDEAVAILASQCTTAVVKIGKRGSLIQTGQKLTRIGIVPVQSIDTTGAGDQYAAGFLYGYSRNLEPEKCGKVGSVLAGTIVKHVGARIPHDEWPQVLKEVDQIIKSS